MISKILNYFKNLPKRQSYILDQVFDVKHAVLENLWAHRYHDSIRGKRFLDHLGLNIGSFAGNYLFFYILHRILSDFKPESIIEFGLGESSKMISKYIENELPATDHTIVEESDQWSQHFQSRFQLSPKTEIVICPLIKRKVRDFDVNSYQDIEKVITEKYQFYLVDGPFRSDRFSRYDILRITQNLEPTDEFVIMIDDANRAGEQDTVKDLRKHFDQKEIKYHFREYTSNKKVSLFCTEQFKYLTTL